MTENKLDEFDITGFGPEAGQIEPHSPSKVGDLADAQQAKVDLLSVADDAAKANSHNDEMN